MKVFLNLVWTENLIFLPFVFKAALLIAFMRLLELRCKSVKKLSDLAFSLCNSGVWRNCAMISVSLFYLLFRALQRVCSEVTAFCAL